MTEQLTDAELNALVAEITGNAALWAANIDEAMLIRAIAELRELRAENATLRADFTRQHNEQQELLDHYRAESAALRAALKDIEQHHYNCYTCARIYESLNLAGLKGDVP